MRSLLIIDKLLISKFIKFGVVGCSGMLIDFGTTYLCKEILRLNKYYDFNYDFYIESTNLALNEDNYMVCLVFSTLFHKEIVQKTDNRDLCEYSVISLSTFGYKIEDIIAGLCKSIVLNYLLTKVLTFCFLYYFYFLI